METIAKYEWRIAALTLITLPLSIWAAVNLLNDSAMKALIFVGMAPLILAVTAESLNDLIKGWKVYKQTGVVPESKLDGSPAGNLFAKVLLVLFILVFVVPIIVVIFQGLLR